MKLLFLCIFILLSCQKKEQLKVLHAPVAEITPVPESENIDREFEQNLKQFFSPLPDSLIDVQKNRELILLGKKYFSENCQSCHQLEKFGARIAPLKSKREIPSIYNTALNFSQFWDGRARDLENVLPEHLNDLDQSSEQVVKKLETQTYRELFGQAFGDFGDQNLNLKNLALALSAYQSTLLSPARFDDFLKGKREALSADELLGLKKFVEVGCINCHQGVNLGGNSFQKLGLKIPYNTEDSGRYFITQDEEDRFVFKVPGLRNVTKTGPYFHDGSIKSLDEAIKLMAKHQLDLDLETQEISLIQAFLGSLEAMEMPPLDL